MKPKNRVIFRNRISGIKWMRLACLLIAMNFMGTYSLYAQTVWLDQLDVSAATQGYGVPNKNKTVDGRTMTIAGKTFERGFGTHSESSLLIQLD
ncbi:MAG: NPCBM/NEW2 domain-containing protein, partial [Flavisolibacter sp.]